MSNPFENPKVDASAMIDSLIATAEEIHDPWSEVIAKAAADPKIIFEQEILRKVAEVKRVDPTLYNIICERLRSVGCDVILLQRILSAEKVLERTPRPIETLASIVSEAALFHTPDGRCFADIEVNSHRETWAVRSNGCRRWLARRYYEETRNTAGAEVFQTALNLAEARAQYDSPEIDVHVRVAEFNGKLYIDLCDVEWQAIEVDASGWRILQRPPVRFRRCPGMAALPMPVAGGAIDALRPFLNVGSDEDFVLVVSWLLMCMRARGPYPVLVLSGEQGSAKSTFSELLRGLVDPNTAPLRALPREERDLYVSASNSHLLAFDNVSDLQPLMSDSLCRLATGGSFAIRQLYTDGDEILFNATRPIILNGIEDVVTRPDLADRALFLKLEPIAEDQRKPDVELREHFRAEQPKILGALLDMLVEGLKRLPEVKLPTLPRMADFAMLATACETKSWPKGTFWRAYAGNRESAVQDMIDADPTAAIVCSLVAESGEWFGTASDLVGIVKTMSGGSSFGAKVWPASPSALSGKLRRVAPFLRKAGIEISFHRQGRGRTRLIKITADKRTASADASADIATPPSAPSRSF